jgi:ribose transport system ATP-binding protein
MDEATFLVMKNISKTYGGIKALQKVELDLKSGEVLGLVGENGAGKSTLMKILCGIEAPDPDGGEILLSGKEEKLASPHQAQRLGIAMIPQELMLVPNMSVTENIFLGREKTTRGRFLKKQEMAENTKVLLQRLRCDHIDPESTVSRLSKAEQQLVAIARRLLQGGKIFIMDEPTAALTEHETKNLFSIIKDLCESGHSVIFISHRLEEVLTISDRITVLKDGELVTTIMDVPNTKKEALILHMIGVEVKDEFPKLEVETGKEVLRVEQIAFATNQGIPVRDISFTVHEGEVVGITGLIGVGKTELGQTLIGTRNLLAGGIFLDNERIRVDSPIEAVRLGFGYVSEDRRGEGVVLQMPGLYNMTFSNIGKVSAGGFLLNKMKEIELGLGIAGRLGMRNEFLFMDAWQLSGGNQQKLVVIRQIFSESRLVIFDEPTKGIDVAAKSEIARIISELSKDRKAIVILSSEPHEVLGISDTIFILTRKGMQGPFARGTLDYEKLMSVELAN